MDRGAGLHPEAGERRLGVERIEDRGAQERPRGHAQEREGADHPERPRPAEPREQVRGRGGGDRHQCSAAGGLHQPSGHELLQRLGPAGQRRADREQHQGREEQPPVAPQVGQPAGERHRHDVHEEVAVDDPRRLAKPGPVGEDR